MDLAILSALNGKGVFLAEILSSKWMLVGVGVPLLLLFAKQKKWRAIFALVLSIAISDLMVVRVLKPMVGRVRPCHTLQDIEAPLGCGPGKSFPSAHSSNGFAVCVTAAAHIPYGYYFLLPIAAGVAWSRVALGVHYPSDILFGALFGSLFAFLSNFLAFRISKKNPATEIS